MVRRLVDSGLSKTTVATSPSSYQQKVSAGSRASSLARAANAPRRTPPNNGGQRRRGQSVSQSYSQLSRDRSYIAHPGSPNSYNSSRNDVESRRGQSTSSPREGAKKPPITRPQTKITRHYSNRVQQSSLRGNSSKPKSSKPQRGRTIEYISSNYSMESLKSPSYDTELSLVSSRSHLAGRAGPVSSFESEIRVPAPATVTAHTSTGLSPTGRSPKKNTTHPAALPPKPKRMSLLAAALAKDTRDSASKGKQLREYPAEKPLPSAYSNATSRMSSLADALSKDESKDDCKDQRKGDGKGKQFKDRKKREYPREKPLTNNGAASSANKSKIKPKTKSSLTETALATGAGASFFGAKRSLSRLVKRERSNLTPKSSKPFNRTHSRSQRKSKESHVSKSTKGVKKNTTKEVSFVEARHPKQKTVGVEQTIKESAVIQNENLHSIGVYDSEFVHVRIRVEGLSGLRISSCSDDRKVVDSLTAYACFPPGKGHFSSNSSVKSSAIDLPVVKGKSAKGRISLSFPDTEEYLYLTIPLRKTAKKGLLKLAPFSTSINIGVKHGAEEIHLGTVPLTVDGTELSQKEKSINCKIASRVPSQRRSTPQPKFGRRRSSLQEAMGKFKRIQTSSYTLEHDARLQMKIDARRGEFNNHGAEFWSTEVPSRPAATLEECVEVVQQDGAVALISTKQFGGQKELNSLPPVQNSVKKPLGISAIFSEGLCKAESKDVIALPGASSIDGEISVSNEGSKQFGTYISKKHSLEVRTQLSTDTTDDDGRQRVKTDNDTDVHNWYGADLTQLSPDGSDFAGRLRKVGETTVVVEEEGSSEEEDSSEEDDSDTDTGSSGLSSESEFTSTSKHGLIDVGLSWLYSPRSSGSVGNAVFSHSFDFSEPGQRGAELSRRISSTIAPDESQKKTLSRTLSSDSNSVVVKRGNSNVSSADDFGLFMYRCTGAPRYCPSNGRYTPNPEVVQRVQLPAVPSGQSEGPVSKATF